jgi:hypothetical protein
VAAKIAAPRNPRELFRLLACYEQSGDDLGGLFDRVDLSGVTGLQVYQSVLRRSPDPSRAGWGDPYDAKAHFIAALTSFEFRAKAIEHFLDAFSDKNRLLFIHIPKCAGTDLRAKLLPKFVSLSLDLSSQDWTADNERLAALGAAARSAESTDEILVYGHLQLDFYLAKVGARVQDRIFTVIRDPVEIAISQANYAITILVNDPAGSRPDARDNLNRLGLDRLPENAGPAMLKELALRAFLDSRITKPNLICGHLASIGKGHAEAIRNIVTHGVEVTDTARYNSWVRQAWGIDSQTRHNSSMKFLSRADLEPYRDRLDMLTSEDRKVFDLIGWALSKTGTPSIRGSELPAVISENAGPYWADLDRNEIVCP